jgi:hypothetical protein
MESNSVLFNAPPVLIHTVALARWGRGANEMLNRFERFSARTSVNR